MTIFDTTNEQQNIGLVGFVAHDDQCPGTQTTGQQAHCDPIREVTGRKDGQPTRAGASLELRGQVPPSAGLDDIHARTSTSRRYGTLHLDGYSGRSSTRVEIVGETPKRYRIRAITQTRTAGRLVYLEPGQMALVPKHAVVLEQR